MITLPWPDPALSPNKRIDRRALIGIKAKAKQAAWALTRKSNAGSFKHLAEHGLHVRYTFNPPDRRRRDLDNLLSSMKSAIDGLALAIGVDDSEFRVITLQWGDVVKGGSVVVDIGHAQAFIPFRGQIS